MKNLVSLLAVFFMSVTLLWSREQVSKDVLTIKAEQDTIVDYYLGKTSVPDGFGGTWNVITDVWYDGISYYLVRPSTPYSQSDPKHRTGDWLETDKKKFRPTKGQLRRAFWGYRHALQNAIDNTLYIYLWVDPRSGRVKEVAYEFKYTLERAPQPMHAIPPMNYTIFESILKRTVRFDVANYRFSEREISSGYCFMFWKNFKYVYPDKHEPDLVKRVSDMEKPDCSGLK